jgi:glycosyltransferase involved in cell wall biosynthesis
MLSVLVTTFNEAENLPACLEGVTWADEIVVVDSGSTDATRDLARAHGAKVLEHAYESAARQKNWALPQLSHPWILILDADERVPPALAGEIRAVVAQDGPADGYFLRRRSFFLGSEIRHCGWGQDRVLRLFRRDRASYDDRWVHETLQLDARPPRDTIAARDVSHHGRMSRQDSLHDSRRGGSASAAGARRGSRFWYGPRPASCACTSCKPVS